jgi:hypothetical protein
MLVIEVHDSDLDREGLLSPGSIPRYCLKSSPVPVTVVNPRQRHYKKDDAD